MLHKHKVLDSPELLSPEERSWSKLRATVKQRAHGAEELGALLPEINVTAEKPAQVWKSDGRERETVRGGGSCLLA